MLLYVYVALEMPDIRENRKVPMFEIVTANPVTVMAFAAVFLIAGVLVERTAAGRTKSLRAVVERTEAELEQTAAELARVNEEQKRLFDKIRVWDAVSARGETFEHFTPEQFEEITDAAVSVYDGNISEMVRIALKEHLDRLLEENSGMTEGNG